MRPTATATPARGEQGQDEARDLGHGDRDRYSLAEVTALKVLAGLECRKCKFAAVGVDELTGLHGCQFSLGEVRHLARCRRCASKLPFVLIRSQPLAASGRPSDHSISAVSAAWHSISPPVSWSGNPVGS